MKRYLFFRFLGFLWFFIGALSSGQNRKSQLEKSSPESYKAGAFIDVNTSGYPQSSYSIEDLIKKVLVSGGSNCGESVSNVVVSPNTAVTNTNRPWGYFNKGTANFTFDEGIILSTGYARNAGNSYQSSTLSDNLGTGSDPDLVAAINPLSTLYDAVYIEFDFVPYTEELTFNYLFASEEYTSSFPCGVYSDGFALLLKKQGDPNYTNLAKLPNGTPVSVTNIVPSSYYCGPKNATYFGGHNTTNTVTNFNGWVVPLQAKATVIPGQTYHFKMVLADAFDRVYDSAVFLEAGSFNIGVQFEDEAGLILPSSIVLCSNEPRTVIATTSVENPVFKWYKDGVLIPGVTGDTYVIAEPGIYTVEVYISTSECPVGTKDIEVLQGQLPAVQNWTVPLCSSTATAVFNLVAQQSHISTETGVSFKFYENEDDAIEGNTNTISNPNAYTSGSKTIYVRVSNGTCYNIAELELVVNPNPETPQISAPTTVLCGNDSIVLSSSSSSGNIWSTGETTSTITVTEPGTYTLYTTNGNCNSGTTSVTVTQQPDINLQISGDLNLCYGESTVLTSSSPTGNVWSTGETGQSITVTESGTYTVTVTTAGGCTFEKSVVVTIQNEIVSEDASLTKCSEESTYLFNLTDAEPDLSSTSNVSYTYYEEEPDATSGNSNYIQNPTAYLSGTKTIYVKIGIGECFNVQKLNLKVNLIPDLPVITAANTVLCENSSIVLSSSSSTGNIWSTGETGQTITVTQPGIYSVYVQNAGCASETASITITAQPDINLQISGDATICEGGTTELTSNSSLPTVWNTGETGQTITVSQPGTYTVTVTTENGCVFTDSVVVTQIPAIVLDIVQPQIITCATGNIVLDASGSNYQQGDIVSWTASNGGHIVSGGNTLTPTVDTAGTYTLLLKRGKCTETLSVEVEENRAEPPVVIIADRNTICQGESVTLTAAGAVSYVWSGIQSNENTLIVTPAETTTYTVIGTGANGCKKTQTITITVVPKIVSDLQGGPICEGDFITLDAGENPNYTYLWNTGETTSSIDVNELGEYTVTIDNGVCSETFTTEVIQGEIPEISDVLYSANSLTILATNPGGILEYTIDGGVTWQTSNSFSNLENNNLYSIGVRLKGTSCIKTAEYFTFNISNVITPNDDGFNDVIDFRAVIYLHNFSATIYDRMGMQVFKAENTKQFWDGKLGGRPLPTDSYWYVIIWDNPFTAQTETKTGWILLKNRE